MGNKSSSSKSKKQSIRCEVLCGGRREAPSRVSLRVLHQGRCGCLPLFTTKKVIGDFTFCDGDWNWASAGLWCHVTPGVDVSIKALRRLHPLAPIEAKVWWKHNTTTTTTTKVWLDTTLDDLLDFMESTADVVTFKVTCLDGVQVRLLGQDEDLTEVPPPLDGDDWLTYRNPFTGYTFRLPPPRRSSPRWEGPWTSDIDELSDDAFEIIADIPGAPHYIFEELIERRERNGKWKNPWWTSEIDELSETAQEIMSAIPGAPPPPCDTPNNRDTVMPNTETSGNEMTEEDKPAGNTHHSQDTLSPPPPPPPPPPPLHVTQEVTHTQVTLGYVSDVTHSDVTLDDVTLGDVTLDDVTLDDVTLGDVTLDDVTLSNVTYGDVTYGDVTFNDVTFGHVSLPSPSVRKKRVRRRRHKDKKIPRQSDSSDSPVSYHRKLRTPPSKHHTVPMISPGAIATWCFILLTLWLVKTADATLLH